MTSKRSKKKRFTGSTQTASGHSHHRDRGHNHNKILDFKTDNRHWGSGHYCMQGILVYKVTVTNSWLGNCRLMN